MVWFTVAPTEGTIYFMRAVGGVGWELLALVSVLHHGPEILAFLPFIFPTLLPVLTLFHLLNAKYFFKLATSSYLSILAILLLLIV